MGWQGALGAPLVPRGGMARSLCAVRESCCAEVGRLLLLGRLGVGCRDLAAQLLDEEEAH